MVGFADLSEAGGLGSVVSRRRVLIALMALGVGLGGLSGGSPAMTSTASAAAPCAVAPSHAPAILPDTLGVNIVAILPAQREPFFRLAQSYGITVARQDAAWWPVEPSGQRASQFPFPDTNPTYHWSIDGTNRWFDYDALVSGLAGHCIRWQPILDQYPNWALGRPSTGNPSVDQSNDYPPAMDAAFAQFAAGLALRYGVHGTFWADPKNAGIPYTPVTTYEIDNEENDSIGDGDMLSAAGVRMCEPEEYGRAFIAAARAIHAVDPEGTVVLGGLGGGINFGTDPITNQPLGNCGHEYFMTQGEQPCEGQSLGIDCGAWEYVVAAEPNVGIGLHPYAPYYKINERPNVQLDRVARFRTALRGELGNAQVGPAVQLINSVVALVVGTVNGVIGNVLPTPGLPSAFIPPLYLTEYGWLNQDLCPTCGGAIPDSVPGGTPPEDRKDALVETSLDLALNHECNVRNIMIFDWMSTETNGDFWGIVSPTLDAQGNAVPYASGDAYGRTVQLLSGLDPSQAPPTSPPDPFAC
jgi:hypothetical protein